MRSQPVRCRRYAAATLLAVLCLCVPGAPGIEAQLSAPASGTVEAGLLLRQLDGEKRVLMVGAHPDDEDTALLTALARGYGAQTAYLSLSRGEGGQNLIGPEMGEGLGLVRTGELIAARELDGARQYFSRAFDFGFSKNAEETFGHWPEEELVRDVVWVVRQFRPQIVVSVFSGTPQDGHGQHQAAGIATRRAFELAGDPSVFPEQLEMGVDPWSPQRLYQLDRWIREPSTVTVETGRLDPLLGRSWFQIAMDSRSQHRSQDMGVPQTPGPQRSGGVLLDERSPGESAAGSGSDEPASGNGTAEQVSGSGTDEQVSGSGTDEPGPFFAGIDTTLATVVRRADLPAGDALLGHMRDYRDAVARANELLHPLDPARSAPALRDALRELDEAMDLVRDAEPGEPAVRHLLRALQEREEIATRALLAAAGVRVEARIDRSWIVPGDRVGAEVSIWNGGQQDVHVDGVELHLPSAWSIASGEDVDGIDLEPNSLRTWSFTLDVPETAALSQPYFLREERSGDLYEWPADPELMGRPGNEPIVVAETRISVGPAPSVGEALSEGEALTVEAATPATHVGVDKASGEFRVPVHVLPALSVEMEPSTLAWPLERAEARPVTVGVRNLSPEEREATVSLEVDEGWEVAPAERSVTLPANGGQASVTFDIRPTGTAAGRAVFRAVATSDARVHSESVTLIDYPHIDPVPLIRPARLDVVRAPIEVRPDFLVGYVMGSGDAGLGALEDLDVSVELLGPAALASAELDRFDAIVLGIRAYETRPDLISANERLLDFARQGGTVVVQYNKYEYPAGGFAPYPLEMARPHDRVTNPNAEVTFLEPQHPVLTRPNRLSAEDFEGWVQERGLYFLNSWDERYVPLLEMADPGEAPSRGSLVVARVGEGVYLYTGLALFRQLPAGVPGAYRLLANLVSLQGSDL